MHELINWLLMKMMGVNGRECKNGMYMKGLMKFVIIAGMSGAWS